MQPEDKETAAAVYKDDIRKSGALTNEKDGFPFYDDLDSPP